MQKEYKELLGKYRHFKGSIVKVVHISLDSETMEKYVVYIHSDPAKGLGKNTCWHRRFDMFFEEIERDGKKMKRFEKMQ